jgi:(p)ppGpp synthase/HD superfamily hydrolase
LTPDADSGRAFALVRASKGAKIMNDIMRIMQAADQAARWHRSQKRKGEAAEPYVNHLLEVASLVAQASDGDATCIIAALMHDVVEDQEITFEQVRALYGDEVTDIVAEVTDDKSLLKQERKDLQVRKAPHKSRAACILKLADKTSNVRAVVQTPPTHWALERKQAYVAWARAVVEGLPYKPAGLLAQFEAATAAADAAFGKAANG